MGLVLCLITRNTYMVLYCNTMIETLFQLYQLMQYHIYSNYLIYFVFAYMKHDRQYIRLAIQPFCLGSQVNQEDEALPHLHVYINRNFILGRGEIAKDSAKVNYHRGVRRYPPHENFKSRLSEVSSGGFQGLQVMILKIFQRRKYSSHLKTPNNLAC